MAHIVLGLVCVALGLWGIAAWWSTFGMVMRGVIPFSLLVFGVTAFLSGTRKAAVGSPQQSELLRKSEGAGPRS